LAALSFKQTISDAFDRRSDYNLLSSRFHECTKSRDNLTRIAIAFQEEMDWLIYTAYGLLPEDTQRPRLR